MTNKRIGATTQLLLKSDFKTIFERSKAICEAHKKLNLKIGILKYSNICKNVDW